MSIGYSKCGTNCMKCPSYKDNLLTFEDRKMCSVGWKKYHGFKLQPEKLIACDGCQPVRKNKIGIRYINCILRRCALENGFDTCANCSIFPCEVFSNRALGNDWVARLRERLGEIPDKEFDIFVGPYLGLPNLEKIRKGLQEEKIIQFKEILIHPRITQFPDELEKSPGFKELYDLLCNINQPVFGLSYAQAESYKERRRHLLKILWTFGIFGKFDEEEQSLHLDHKSFLAQKIHSGFDRITSYFNSLADYGLKAKIIPLWEDRWLTPSGALRRKGVHDQTPPWMMKMEADEDIGGRDLLLPLTTYSRALNNEFGKSGFRKFGYSDMQILWE